MGEYDFYLEEDLYIRSVSIRTAGTGKKLSWAWNNRVEHVWIYCIDEALEQRVQKVVGEILRDPYSVPHGVCSRFEYSVDNSLFISPELIRSHSNPFAILLLPIVHEKPILQNNGENIQFLFNVVGKITYSVKKKVLNMHSTVALPAGTLGYMVDGIFFPIPQIGAEDNQFVLPKTAPAQLHLLFAREEDRRVYTL